MVVRDFDAELIGDFNTGEIVPTMHEIQSSFSGSYSLQDRGLRTPTYDAVDSTGIDISSDFHMDGFDRFEAVRDMSLDDATKRANEKYVKHLYDSIPDTPDATDTTDTTASVDK